MKILFLLPDFPYPPRGGAALRNLGLIRGVAQAGHEVHLLAFGNPANIQQGSNPLQALCKSIEIIPMPSRSSLKRVQTLLLTDSADMESRRWSGEFVTALERKLKETTFDIIQFENLEMTPYFSTAHQRQPHAKLIYDAHNAESEIQRLAYETLRGKVLSLPLTFYSWVQWKRLSAYEKFLNRGIDGVIAVSDADLAILKKIPSAAPSFLVPNGIDVAEYASSKEADLNLKQPSLVFTGVMDYRPNVDAVLWFANEILPKIKDAHFYIVGNHPTAQVKALGERPNITVTGYVPEVLPYFHQATIMVAPLRIGSGTRLKLLQAMASGSAIISTTVGAMGLNIEPGREMLIADDPASFAAAVNKLLTQEVERLQLGSNGQVFVKSRFDWSVIIPKLLAAYTEIMRR